MGKFPLEFRDNFHWKPEKTSEEIRKELRQESWMRSHWSDLEKFRWNSVRTFTETLRDFLQKLWENFYNSKKTFAEILREFSLEFWENFRWYLH